MVIELKDIVAGGKTYRGRIVSICYNFDDNGTPTPEWCGQAVLWEKSVGSVVVDITAATLEGLPAAAKAAIP